ncbi:DUF4402 domain-containing protein [Marinomonas ostreistagni]|uniref:DUF4402 domain-containing protein n=1 Tax=Marinomonas ostreistagni TaxID=359209 RepID=UPI00194E8AE8|nr:DUF4402 domain-containing protein [Marinomonas ostreistagni]MBM6549637.1 DUF4402 domain-containing protein [Marinomonas ostreistagni]
MNKLTYLVAATALIPMSLSHAAETATGTATVMVQNTFTFGQDSGIDFGTIRAQIGSADGTNVNVMTMTLPADGSNPTVAESVSGDSSRLSTLNIITPGTPGVFSVSGAAPNTALTITLPASPFTLNSSGGGAGPTFEGAITEAYITSGTFANQLYDGTTTFLTTDATGSATFRVGGTLSTDSTGNATNYQDVAYNGQYSITVAY